MNRIFVGLCLMIALNGRAQTFSSGSNGADGALNLTSPGTVVFDPAALGIDSDGDNVFHFTTINIGAGVTVLFKNGPLRGMPVIWLASGNVTIAGTLNLDGQNGYNARVPAELASRGPTEPGPGGYPGGIGATPTTSATAGGGPGGTPGGTNVSNAAAYSAGAGHSRAGASYARSDGGGAAYGNPALIPLRGGSGGGGSGGFISGFGSGGGAGGGAIRIVSSATISIQGTITANGGIGGISHDSTSSFEVGGGGSGGAIHLVANVIASTPTAALLAAGGGTSTGAVGAPGRIRLDTFSHQFVGTFGTASGTLGAPFLVVSPPVPLIRVSTIGGVAVSSTPTGSFVTPDAVLNSPGPVTVAVEARNIPLGTAATLYFTAQNGPDIIVNTTPLAGTLALSTATATVQLATGYSRGFVRATW